MKQSNICSVRVLSGYRMSEQRGQIRRTDGESEWGHGDPKCIASQVASPH